MKIQTLIAKFRATNTVERGDWLAGVLGRLVQDRVSVDATREFLLQIQQVWKSESFSLPLGDDRDRPDPGLLKGMGYRVGWQHGQPTETREIVIYFLLRAEHLPPIKDQLYMAEWGDPRSWKRYQKFDRVLQNLRDQYLGVALMSRAVGEWHVDREFAKKEWERIQSEESATQLSTGSSSS